MAGLGAAGLGQVLIVLFSRDLLLGRGRLFASLVLLRTIVDVATILVMRAAALLHGGHAGSSGTGHGHWRGGRHATSGHRGHPLGGWHALRCGSLRLQDGQHARIGTSACGGGHARATESALGAATRFEAMHHGVHVWLDHAASHSAAHVAVCATARLQGANVLLAGAFGVCFLLVAVHEAVSRQGAATGLAGLATSVDVALGARNLAALLELALGDRAHARLRVGVQGLGGRPV